MPPTITKGKGKVDKGGRGGGHDRVEGGMLLRPNEPVCSNTLKKGGSQPARKMLER